MDQNNIQQTNITNNDNRAVPQTPQQGQQLNATTQTAESNTQSSVAQPNLDEKDQKIQDLEKRAESLENNWKRAAADYKNLEKRVAEERADFVAFANAVLLQRILPVLDNLELLETHLNDTGLKLIIKDFKQVLTDVGVKEIETTNKQFDATTMEAVDTIEGDENKVITTEQKGYFLKDKLLRPARVKVGKNSA